MVCGAAALGLRGLFIATLWAEGAFYRYALAEGSIAAFWLRGLFIATLWAEGSIVAFSLRAWFFKYLTNFKNI